MKLQSTAYFLGFMILMSCSKKKIVSSETIQFNDVSSEIGLNTDDNWKYGGPTIADLNLDGHYDLLLGNHDTAPIQLFWGNNHHTFTEQKGVFNKADLHGMAAGDYDKDGDLDILISLGGGNGLKPQPQRLLRNDNGQFTDVTEEAGLSEMGARGRSVRWIDLDNDGDLDFLQINAEQMVNEEIPRNILFENNGNATFSYKPNPVFEEINAERLLITDFDNDNTLDLITFSPYAPTQLWKGNNDFTFTNMSHQLPESAKEALQILTVAESDIDNDGDMDYYFVRGKSTYQMANNAVSFNEETGRMDLRDEGNKSHDGISFYSDGPIELLEFYRFPRGPQKPTIPLFVGKNKTEFVMPHDAQKVTSEEAKGFPESLDASGWYLGYLGEGKWRLEWILQSDLAWDVRASIKGINKIEPDWTPQNLGVQDLLLRNDGDKFIDISNSLPIESSHNNYGVIAGDFNNDSKNDFFIYRFGELKSRVPDALLINDGNGNFTSTLTHGASIKEHQDSHGDMGATFDYNLDGKIDILSGDDDNGNWHMYQNISVNTNNYILIQIGNSPNNYDSYGAKVTVTTTKGTQHKIVGSISASHAQSHMNTVHFGLGRDSKIKKIEVNWRDGTKLSKENISTNQLINISAYD